MDFLTTFLISLGLSMDCFAVAITSGVLLKTIPWKQALKMAVFFGLFQALMPVAGWLIGASFQKYVELFDHWVAFILLAYLGGKMIYEGIKTENEEEKAENAKKNPLNTKVLFGLAIATSIDAMAVGISFAFLNISIITPVIAIGIITFLVSLLGIGIGTKFGQRFNFPVEIFGGLILIAIGVKILVEHLIQ